MFPLRQVTTLSAMLNASGPLTLITEIAPVPGTVAGAQIVSSFFIYILFYFFSAARHVLNGHKYAPFPGLTIVYGLYCLKAAAKLP